MDEQTKHEMAPPLPLGSVPCIDSDAETSPVCLCSLDSGGSCRPRPGGCRMLAHTHQHLLPPAHLVCLPNPHLERGGGKRRSCPRSARVPCQQVARKGYPLPMSPPHGLRCSYQTNRASFTPGGGRIGQALVSKSTPLLNRDTSATDPTRGWNPSQVDAWTPPPTTALPRRLSSLDTHSSLRVFPSWVRLWLIIAVHGKVSEQGTAAWLVAIDTGHCACRSLIQRSVYVDWGRYPAKRRAWKKRARRRTWSATKDWV